MSLHTPLRCGNQDWAVAGLPDRGHTCHNFGPETSQDAAENRSLVIKL